MNWIKIEPGCDMPEEDEEVLARRRPSAVATYRPGWKDCVWECGSYCIPAHEVTHWARITPPEENQ